MTNPLFNGNRTKLGLFAFNGVGNTISNLPPRDASWPTNLRVAQIADAAGFEALVSYARWKGVPRPEPLPFVPHDAFEAYARYVDEHGNDAAADAVKATPASGAHQLIAHEREEGRSHGTPATFRRRCRERQRRVEAALGRRHRRRGTSRSGF
jgi:hypothetical protein